jgi:ribose 5-phosphate isomerase A
MLPKRAAARHALSYIGSGHVVGVGTGSTVMEFMEILAGAISELRDLLLVPTSAEVEYHALNLGLGKYIVQPWQVDRIDVAIDGADEVDPVLNLTKGGGGAMTREKIIDYRASRFIVIVDESKLVDRLGSRAPIPIEVIPTSWRFVSREVVEALGGSVNLRFCEGKRGPVVTDNGNYILDWRPREPLEDPVRIEGLLKGIPGVVESGIFSGSRVSLVIVGKPDGSVIEVRH